MTRRDVTIPNLDMTKFIGSKYSPVFMGDLKILWISGEVRKKFRVLLRKHSFVKIVPVGAMLNWHWVRVSWLLKYGKQMPTNLNVIKQREFHG